MPLYARALLSTILFPGLIVATVIEAASPSKSREPLPLEIAASLRLHVEGAPLRLSPDGQWIAHTANTAEVVQRDSPAFSPSGVPFAEGGQRRKQAYLTSTQNGEVIPLGGSGVSSWSPVWSPDSQRVAYYADVDGEAGLWIWDRDTRQARRFPGVIVRPYFGFETPRWSADGNRILCKILPKGMSVAEANALIQRTEGRRYPDHGPGEASVLVLSAAAKDADAPQGEKLKAGESDRFNRSLADLALLDLQSGVVTRIAELVKPLWYAFSPDESSIAYTHRQDSEPDTQQGNHRVELYDMASGRGRSLAANIRLFYGTELSWSPDGRRLAFIESGPLAEGAIHILSLTDGATRSLRREGVPSFNGRFRPPLWDETGNNLYAIGQDGKLWRVDAASGAGTVASEIAGYRISAIVARPEKATLWTTDNGGTAWVLASEDDGGRQSGLFGIGLTTGRSRAALVENKHHADKFNLEANDATGGIPYLSSDQQHPGDVWIFNTKTGRTRQMSHLNPELARYELGAARLIEWYGIDGQPLRGALLLPPGYKNGQRLPMVVWVYGGVNGSDYVNRFGLNSSPVFNLHVLATRGFAVLYPDAPLRTGQAVQDLMRTVTPGVNAAIEQGYADPDRLAVMGNSFGSHNALALIAQTTRFKAAVISAAALHPDLFAGYLEMGSDGRPSRTGYYETGQGGMGGTPWEHRDRYFDNSPLFLFHRIETPLLIGQGDQDGRLIGSDAVFVALRRLGKNVEYRIYEDEGHSITRKANVIDFWRRRLEFLSKHLDLKVDENGAIIPE